MTTETSAPDAALLWARELWPHDGAGFHNSAAEAFRAGQAHADAALLAALEAIASPNKLLSYGDPTVLRDYARAAITAAKGQADAEG